MRSFIAHIAGKVLFVALILFTVSAQGQYVQFNKTSLYNNPAFAGSAGLARLSTAHSILESNGTSSHFMAYDQFIPELYGGVGVYLNRSNMTSIWKARKNTSFSMMYSPKFTYNENRLTIAPAIGISGHAKYFNYNLIGTSDDNEDTSRIERKFEAALNTGILINTKKTFIGVTWSDVGRTRLGLSGRHGPQFFTQFQFGKTFEKNKKGISFTPVALLNINKKSTSGVQYDWIANFNFRYKKLLWGVNANKGFTFGGMLGYQSKNYRVGFAYTYRDRMYRHSDYFEIGLTCKFPGIQLNKKTY